MININNRRWDKVTSRDIQKVLSMSEDETFFYEFKSDDEEPGKLVKEISALANTYGGYILLGVNNDKSIGGCKKWTEQRIHTTIHDSLTPTPIFDVRRFRIKGKTVYVIKVEEGPLPPYITGKGAIYERLSSGSFPIKDSSRLTQLYNKRIDQDARIKAKIELSAIDSSSIYPKNLCGYLDVGFSVTCSESTLLQKKFYDIDLSSVAKELVGNNSFSIARVGNAYMFTIGQIAQNDESNSEQLLSAGLHDYLIVYEDCSACYRILLFSDGIGNSVDISVVPIVTDFFQKMYRLLCGEDLSKIFIHAQKYESLRVLKQFVPIYDIKRHFQDASRNLFQDILRNHREKYGENLIVQSNRVPIRGYDLIDRQWFNKYRIKYNQNSLIDELFNSSYIHLGYIDPFAKKED